MSSRSLVSPSWATEGYCFHSGSPHCPSHYCPRSIRPAIRTTSPVEGLLCDAIVRAPRSSRSHVPPSRTTEGYCFHSEYPHCPFHYCPRSIRPTIRTTSPVQGLLCDAIVRALELSLWPAMERDSMGQVVGQTPVKEFAHLMQYVQVFRQIADCQGKSSTVDTTVENAIGNPTEGTSTTLLV